MSSTGNSSEENDERDGTSSGTGIVDANNMEERSAATTLTLIALPGAPEPNYKPDMGNSAKVVVAQAGGQRLHLSRLEGLRQRALKGCHDTRTILDQAVRLHLATHDPQNI